MKIPVTFKTPDAVQNVIDEINTDEEGENRIWQVMGRYLEYGEIITIEFDMATGEAKVLEV